MSRYLIEMIVNGPEGTCTQAAEVYASNIEGAILGSAQLLGDTIIERMSEGSPGTDEDWKVYKEGKDEIRTLTAKPAYLDRHR